MHDMKSQLLHPFLLYLNALFDSYVFLQGEAERASPGEAETGGKDHGPVQGSGSQHVSSNQQGQVKSTPADLGPRPRDLCMQLRDGGAATGTSHLLKSL